MRAGARSRLAIAIALSAPALVRAQATAEAEVSVTLRARGEERARGAPRDEVRLHEVERAALYFHGWAAPPNPGAWGARARWSNLLPTLDLWASADQAARAGMRGRTDRFVDEAGASRIDTERDERSTQGTRALEIGARARFTLGGLVFDRRELEAARLERSLLDARRRLSIEVARAYASWRDARGALAIARTEEERARAWSQYDRYSAELDALTGGWLARRLEVGP